MLQLFARRVVISLPILVLVSLVVFLMLHVTPGDPAREVAGGMEATQEQVDAARERLGLDEPIVTQYASWVGGMLTGDLGTSFLNSQSVTSAIWSRLPITLSLTVGAMFVALVIAVPAGILAALRHGGWVDRTVMIFTASGIAMPSFFIGLLLVLFLALNNNWFPATGYVGFSDDPMLWLKHITLPATTLGIAVSAELARYLRASLRDVLDQDYVRTARAKGMPTYKVVGKHALKNAAIPVVTVMGLQVRFLLGGTIVVEQVFGLQGLGALAVKAVFDRDFPIIQGIAMTTVVIVLLVNLLVDMSYAYLNPRVRPT